MVETAAVLVLTLAVFVDRPAELALMIIKLLAIAYEFIMPLPRVSYIAKFWVTRLIILADKAAEFAVMLTILAEMPAEKVLMSIRALAIA